jgi:hypothetical protein
MAPFLDTLNRIADLIRTDPGLAVNASAADIEAGAQAAEAINGLIAEAITALSLNEDGQSAPMMCWPSVAISAAILTALPRSPPPMAMTQAGSKPAFIWCRTTVARCAFRVKT